jgi:hypothetical protein
MKNSKESLCLLLEYNYKHLTQSIDIAPKWLENAFADLLHTFKENSVHQYDDHTVT